MAKVAKHNYDSDEYMKGIEISLNSIFKLRQGASIRANVGRSVGRSVCPWKKFPWKICGKFVESRNQNSLIIFDYLINFLHCWGDRVATKINSKAN